MLEMNTKDITENQGTCSAISVVDSIEGCKVRVIRVYSLVTANRVAPGLLFSRVLTDITDITVITFITFLTVITVITVSTVITVITVICRH